jgi:MFS family permease
MGKEWDKSSQISLFLVALCLALAYGVWYCYSVILVALSEDFGWSRATLSGAFAIFAVVQGCTNPVVGYLCDRVPPPALTMFGGLMLGCALFLDSFIHAQWHLYAYFGVLTSIAVSFCGWAPAVVQVQRRFRSRLGLALGIASSGIGLGMLLVVPLCQLLIQEFGWRMAFRVLALLSSISIIFAATYLLKQWRVRAQDAAYNSITEREAGNSGGRKRFRNLTKLMCTRPFWLMISIFFLGAVSSQTLHVHQVAYLVEHGISAIAAAWVVGTVGIASVFGKTMGGWLSDFVEREKVYIGGLVVLLAAILTIVFAAAYGSIGAAYVYAVFLGIGYSATAAITPAMVSDRFDGEHFGTILGIGLFGSALGSALGPWSAGVLFDLTGSYNISFAIAAFCACLAIMATYYARVLRLRM